MVDLRNTWVCALVLVGVTSLPVAADEARELVRRTLDASTAETAEATIKLHSGSEWREMESIRMRRGGSDRVQLKVISPFNYKGMRYLFHEGADGTHDHYSYLPALKRTVRIAKDSLQQPFLATAFYVVDLIPPDLDAHEYRFVGEEEVGGRACRLVERIPKDPGSTVYGRSVLAIDPADLVVVRTEFFDSDGKPLKTWSIEKLEKIDGVWTPLEQRMKPANGEADWVLSVEKIQYGVPLREQDFATVGIDG